VSLFGYGEDVSWQEDSLCARPEYQHLDFFPERVRPKDLVQQGSLCAKCPVRDNCIDFAKRSDVSHGIWGGFFCDGGWWRKLPVVQENQTKAYARMRKAMKL